MPEETQPEETKHAPGMGEAEVLPGGGITAGDAVPEMPPGSDMYEESVRHDSAPGGGLDAGDLAEPSTMADTTGDRATGLTGLRGG